MLIVSAQKQSHVARLNSDGTIDTAFDPNANDLVTALAIQADGKILLSGFFTTLAPNGGASVFRNVLARLNSNGTVDMNCVLRMTTYLDFNCPPFAIVLLVARIIADNITTIHVC